jgi:hypothetical protein
MDTCDPNFKTIDIHMLESNVSTSNYMGAKSQIKVKIAKAE